MKTIQTYAAIAFLATAITGSAAVINITVGPDGIGLQNGGSNSLASNFFYASIVSGGAGTPNSKADNFLFLQGVIENWNENGNIPPMPTISDSAALPADNGSIADTSSFTAPAGYDYVVFHFGSGPAGGGSDPDEKGWWAAWYLGGVSNTFTLPQEGDPLKNVGGFSSARYFNAASVPDAGSTLISLGIAMLGLGGIRKFLVKA